MPLSHDRRVFLASLTGFAALTRGVAGQSPQRSVAASAEWDLSWLDQFKGKHKQVFDVGNMDISRDTPLRVPMNYLDAFRDVYQMEPPDVNAIIGIQARAFPMNASDAIWEQYKLGERWSINDPQTGKPSTRNIFLGQSSGGPGSMVRPLQARGVLFWQCNVALGNVVARLARETNRPPQEVRAELVAGLNAGVKLVPSHSMMIALVQERGFTYEKP